MIKILIRQIMKYFIGNWKMFGVPKSIGLTKLIHIIPKTKIETNTE